MAVSNAFAFGGTNAVIAVRKIQAREVYLRVNSLLPTTILLPA
jgi:hypothetical protein